MATPYSLTHCWMNEISLLLLPGECFDSMSIMSARVLGSHAVCHREQPLEHTTTAQPMEAGKLSFKNRVFADECG